MLYLVRPGRQLDWADLPATTTLRLAEEHNVDLAKLPWQPSENTDLADPALQLALRHGVACSTGLVVAASYVAEHAHGDEIRQAHSAAADTRAGLGPQNELMEQLFPGWIENSRRLDEAVDQSAAKVAADADEQAGLNLRAPVRQDLADHWTELGGRMP